MSGLNSKGLLKISTIADSQSVLNHPLLKNEIKKFLPPIAQKLRGRGYPGKSADGIRLAILDPLNKKSSKNFHFFSAIRPHVKISDFFKISNAHNFFIFGRTTNIQKIPPL